jgi:hypothetical protein
MQIQLLIEYKNKLKVFKKCFKGWEVNRQGGKEEEKIIQYELKNLEQIEENMKLSLDQILNRTNMLSELMKILEEEELY